VKRHRFGVAAAASAVVLLIGFAAAMTVQARRIAIERDRANRQAETARRVADFMKGIFKVSDPSESRGNSITAREILDNASKEIDTGLAKDPETQAQLMDVMGEVYESLGLQPTQGL
jgi:non-specific serine/threonine protein kinase/serine/threonine-protein kinase